MEQFNWMKTQMSWLVELSVFKEALAEIWLEQNTVTSSLGERAFRHTSLLVIKTLTYYSEI